MNDLISKKDETLEITLKNLYAQGYLTKQRLWQLSHELDLIIQKRVLNFNHGNSTSISFGNYTWIIEAIDYIFVHGYASYKNKEYLLQTTALKDVLYTGVKVIQNEIVEIKDLFEKIKMQAVYFPNDFMKYLIKKEIPSILSAWNSYNFELYYSRIKEDLSYPLLDGLPVLHQMYDLKGSDLVFYYLKRVDMEISFCMLFQKEYAEFCQLFKSIINISVSEVFINLSEICMNQAIASYILHQRLSLLLSETQVKYLKEKLKNTKSVETIVHTAMEAILSFTDKETKEYFMMFQDIWVKNFMDFTFLDVDILVYKKKQDEQLHTFFMKKYSDINFSEMIEQLQANITVKDKIELLQRNQLQIYDMIDLLENAVFFEDEYLQYFRSLDLLSFSILLKCIIMDSSYTDLDDLLEYGIEEDSEWMRYLRIYVQSLHQEQYQEIKNNIASIKIVWK